MSALTAAAFGELPARWPLPTAKTPGDRWLRAVAAGGQGHYAAAFAELAEVRRSGNGPLLSLAHSTHGSLLRQLGWHRLARGWDGRALALAGDDPAARVDALAGLAADALGVGRLAASATLLARAEAALTPDAPARLAVRLAWVGAELSMAGGDGPGAVAHAHRAVGLAGQHPSVRHRIKSDVVCAAALCCAGRLDDSRALADGLLGRTAEHGLVPLRWAVASLLAGIGSRVFSPPEVAEIRDAAAIVVEHGGGHWHRS